jgi:hypothetical protein
MLNTSLERTMNAVFEGTLIAIGRDSGEIQEYKVCDSGKRFILTIDEAPDYPQVMVLPSVWPHLLRGEEVTALVKGRACRVVLSLKT